MRGVVRARRAARWVRQRFAARACILLYHRIAKLPSDPQLLGVTPQHFAEHLEVLRTYGYPMRLQKLSAMLKEARLPHRTVVVTFDDGYADNLSNGEPLLARHDVPATVFATVGYLGQEREFWWDELERVLLQSGPRPAVLHLSIDGRIFHRDLAESSAYSDADYERHRSWNVLNDDDLGPRQAIYRELFKVLRPLRDEQRLKVLAELRSWSGVEAAGRPSHRAVAFSEIAQLRESELLEIGAHTLTHPVLSTLPIVAQQTEIAEGKTRLEEMLGQSVCSFAYPYGTRADYTPKTVALVRQAGFGCACSNFAEAVWRETDPFELPRMVVRDWDGDEFARRLEGWFSA